VPVSREMAGELHRAGMIRTAVVAIHIKDIEQVRAWACECDADVRSHYRRIFESNEADVIGFR
jgi:hypothetical protein